MKIFKWLSLWLLLVVVIGAMLAPDCVNYFRLSRNGVVVQGIALGTAPHYQIEYSFKANGQTYRGVGRTGIGAPSFEHIAVGDNVPVYYLPEAPEVNCLGSPAELYSNDLPPVLLASFVFPTAIIFVLAYRLSKRRARREGRERPVADRDVEQHFS
jgi:hypothetical protein